MGTAITVLDGEWGGTMRISIPTTIFLATLIALSVPATAPALDNVEVAPLGLGRQVSFDSAVLGEGRSIYVATPSGYEASQDPCPVLVVLDGRTQFLHTVASASVLANTGRIPPMIVVGILNVDRRRDFTGQIQEGRPSGNASAFLRFLADEVLAMVDNSYRTAPYRILIGHSLGGLLAVHAMIERPKLFSAYIAISPAITAEEQDLPEQEKRLTHQLAEVFDKGKLRNTRMFITMSGREDPRWFEDLDTLTKVFKKHAPKDFAWKMEKLPDETHGSTVVKSTFDGLKWIFQGFDGREALESESLKAVLDNYRSLTQQLGFKIRPPEELLNILGYRLLAAAKFDQAIATFEQNVKEYPDSANVYDSLGEALERHGRLPGALINYRKACRLAEKANDPLLKTFIRNRDRVGAKLDAHP